MFDLQTMLMLKDSGCSVPKERPLQVPAHDFVSMQISKDKRQDLQNRKEATLGPCVVCVPMSTHFQVNT